MYRKKERTMCWHQVQQVILLIYNYYSRKYIRWKNFLNELMSKKTQMIGIHSLYYASQWHLNVLLSRISFTDKYVEKCNYGAFIACHCAALWSRGNAFFSLARVRVLSLVVNVIGNQFATIYRTWQQLTRSGQLTTGFHLQRL